MSACFLLRGQAGSKWGHLSQATATDHAAVQLAHFFGGVPGETNWQRVGGWWPVIGVAGWHPGLGEGHPPITLVAPAVPNFTAFTWRLRHFDFWWWVARRARPRKRFHLGGEVADSADTSIKQQTAGKAGPWLMHSGGPTCVCCEKWQHVWS